MAIARALVTDPALVVVPGSGKSFRDCPDVCPEMVVVPAGSFTMGSKESPHEQPPHKVTIARQVLRDYKPVDGLWPTEHLPTRRAAARERFAHVLEGEVGNL